MAKSRINIAFVSIVTTIIVSAIFVLLFLQYTRRMPPSYPPTVIIPPQTQTQPETPPQTQQETPPQTQTPSLPAIRQSEQTARQLGLLVEGTRILPFFGYRLHHDRWVYWTTSDQFNSNRLPVQVNEQDCEDQNGCIEVFDGDKVFVPAYGTEFTVQLYKNVIRYNPFSF